MPTTAGFHALQGTENKETLCWSKRYQFHWQVSREVDLSWRLVDREGSDRPWKDEFVCKLGHVNSAVYLNPDCIAIPGIRCLQVSINATLEASTHLGRGEKGIEGGVQITLQ